MEVKDVPKFHIGQRVWFLKSMRMCRVVEIQAEGYVVEVMDSGKKLWVTEDGLEACE